MTTPDRTSKPTKIRIACVSDTHGHSPGEGYKLPAGDVLIIAGDLTNQGSLPELEKAARWVEQAEFEHKIIIAGNHDLSLDDKYHLKHAEGWRVAPSEVEQCRRLIRNIPGTIYLEHEDCKLHIKGRTLQVFGSPYSIDRGKQNWAFQYNVEDGPTIWDVIPEDTDILITHTPSAGVLDESRHWTDGGCASLLTRLSVVKPMLHIFGHHHEGRGACILQWNQQEKPETVAWTDPGEGNRKQSLLDLTRYEQKSGGRYTAAINASIMRKSWSRSAAKEFNKPIVVDIDINTFAYT